MEENGQLVQFIFNTEREVISEQEENKWTIYIRGSELLASSSDYAKTYYHYTTDEMGSITHIVDDKNILNHYEYDVWGNVVKQKETVKNRFKFTGEQLDPITQQYYLRARFYNPVIARFTQDDTYRGDGLNLYAYCGNNPIKYVDPTGNACDPIKNFINNSRGKGEVVYKTEATLEGARNDLIKIVDELGLNKNGSMQNIGRLEKSYGNNKIIGRKSFDDKISWRLDYDETKGVHFNIEDYSKGKRENSLKIIIPINIDEKQYKNIIDLYNKGF